MWFSVQFDADSYSSGSKRFDGPKLPYERPLATSSGVGMYSIFRKRSFRRVGMGRFSRRRQDGRRVDLLGLGETKNGEL